MRALHVRSVGLFAPGFPDARSFFEDRIDQRVLAPDNVLPPRLRRGASLVTRMMADVAAQATRQAGFDARTVRTVYASAFGEAQTALSILSMLHEADGVVSPARFATSVHNSASGLVSIADCNQASSTAVAAGRSTVAMGLLEAASLLHSEPGPVVVVFADEAPPEALAPGLGFAPLAVSLGLTDDPAGSIACVERLRRGPRGPASASSPAFGPNPIEPALGLVRAIFSAAPAVVALEAHGTLPWSATVTPPQAPVASLPTPIELLPHRPPMLLLDEVTSWNGDRVECRVVLRDDSPFVEAGRVASTIAVEYMAQCVAAFAGLRGRERGEPVRIGYLVGAREVTFAVDDLRVGDVLRVEASPVWGDETLGNFACAVDREGEAVARGTLNVYQGELPDMAPV